MSHHEKVVCKECKKTISTCRCSAPKTEITYDICEDCKGKEK